ncbi:MAG: hypothetical protein OEY14_11445 [Myxococcales bacterium]|nr:hypothetical protein [Myxococcales bacterium]
MSLTLAQVARTSGRSLAPISAIEEALGSLGRRAEDALEGLDREARSHLVGLFIRRLRGVGVQASHDLERVLLAALGASPQGEHTVAITDAIAIIRARNHVAQVCKTLEMSWAESMKVQSAVSETLRYVSSHGGGLLETHVLEGQAVFEIKIREHEGPVGADAFWLFSIATLTQEFSTHSQGRGVTIRFWLGKSTGDAATEAAPR